MCPPKGHFSTIALQTPDDDKVIKVLGLPFSASQRGLGVTKNFCFFIFVIINDISEDIIKLHK